jgi:hypothetical protein
MMRKLFFVLVFLILSVPVFPQINEFIPFQDYEPAFIDADSMLTYEGKLARWENGWLYTKDVSKKKAAWKKVKKLKPQDMFVRIFKDNSATLHEIPAIKNISINKSGTFMAFTISFGGSAVSSAGVVDMTKNRLVYAADLKQKSKDFGGPPMLPMENAWFIPSITEDGKYMVCDGFKGTGERESALINIADKRIDKFAKMAMPVLSGNMVFLWEQNAVKKKNYIWASEVTGGGKKIAADFQGAPAGLQAINGRIYAITADKIFSFDAATGGDFKEIQDYSYLSKGYSFMSTEKTFAGFVNGKAYVFLALKRIKDEKYDWKLFGLQVE